MMRYNHHLTGIFPVIHAIPRIDDSASFIYRIMYLLAISCLSSDGYDFIEITDLPREAITTLKTSHIHVHMLNMCENLVYFVSN